MGYRNLTPKEFSYIRELIKKYPKSRGGLKKVAELSGRSMATLGYVKNSETWGEYLENRPGGLKKPKTSTRGKVEAKAKRKEPKNYDGAILAETSRLRKSIDKLTSLLEEITSPVSVSKADFPSDVLNNPALSQIENEPPQREDEESFIGVVIMVIVLIGAIALISWGLPKIW